VNTDKGQVWNYWKRIEWKKLLLRFMVEVDPRLFVKNARERFRIGGKHELSRGWLHHLLWKVVEPK